MPAVSRQQHNNLARRLTEMIQSNKMDEQLPQRIYQNQEFTVHGFTGKKIAQLTGIESAQNSSNAVVVVYLKVADRHFQRFFLDAGIGFWEETTTMEESEEGFIEIDYAEKFNIRNLKINTIHCEKEQNNSRIVITLENKTLVILRCKHPEIIDATYELIKTNE